MAEGDENRPLLIKNGESNNYDDEQLSSQGSQLLQDNTTDWRAPATILGIECLESMAFNGIATNLVVYLRTVLHENNASSAAKVSIWYGTSYFVPIIGAGIADTYWGNYKTVLISLILYFLGMLSTSILSLPSLSTNSISCANTSESDPCDMTSRTDTNIFFIGLFLIALGCGGVRSSLLPFGADQFNDENNLERQKKISFFSWFYVCVIFGVISSGTVIVWIQENISWSLGFGISSLCIAFALGGFLIGTRIYKRKLPSGSPLKSICQVLVASFRKFGLRVPDDSSALYEIDCKSTDDVAQQPRLARTNDFRFLDKAAIISDTDVESSMMQCSWRVCTVTQVEELKILLRLVPIWATGVIHSSAFSQMHTTFIQQGTAMNTKMYSFSIPAASLYSFEVVCVMTWVFFYNKIIVRMANGVSLSQLQRIGIGRFLMIIAMATAAIVEMVRLDSFKNGERTISVLWQLPQYFIVAGSEFFSLITQLEFFHGQAPDSMKSMCTAFALLTIAMGNYLSSFIIMLVAIVTTEGGNTGWIPNDLNEGHLDYYFWAITAMSALNFAVYAFFARKYKLKEAILAI